MWKGLWVPWKVHKDVSPRKSNHDLTFPCREQNNILSYRIVCYLWLEKELIATCSSISSSVLVISSWIQTQKINDEKDIWKIIGSDLIMHLIICKFPYSKRPLRSDSRLNLKFKRVHRILQARKLEWIAIPFFRGSSQPSDQTQVSHSVGRFFTIWATREALKSRKR